ncbi:hypothetical protein DVH24_037675 [Malus domestica]|uniref:F-actin-capping protein subunit beta n=1 Tax=Malus domestica TaxID=3750 RepID=A0A498IXU2_MALDO|nr:hypothetical protein DVH24_037675 [Malus domestica]
MEAAMGLMRQMPPKHTETALSALLFLLPQHSSDLLSQVDQPLQQPPIFRVGGNLKLKQTTSLPFIVTKGHICNMGRMIEEMESKLRNSLDQVLCFLTCTLTFLHPALQFILGRRKRWFVPLRPPSEVVMRLPDS